MRSHIVAASKLFATKAGRRRKLAVGIGSEVHSSRSKAPFSWRIDTQLAQVRRVPGIERASFPAFLSDTSATEAKANPRG